MSRIGKTNISIPEGVSVEVMGSVVKVKGPKGELTQEVLPQITVAVKDGEVELTRKNNTQQVKALHGLFRSLIANHVQGVTEGYKKTLKLVGTGYRAQAKGQGVSLAVGFSHPVEFDPLEGVMLKVEGNDTIHVEGINKRDVGQVAADLRKVRPPEAYKGKGIRYENEVVRLKPGKTVA